MKDRRLRLPRPATLIACLALFAAVAGTAFAASKVVKRNTVVSKSIRDGAVKAVDVRDDALTGAEIAEATLAPVPEAARAGAVGPGAVGPEGLATDAVTNAKIAEGAVNGTEIIDGGVTTLDLGDNSVAARHMRSESVGADALKQPTAVVGSGQAITAGNTGEATVTCPLGTQILAGGFAWQDTEANSILHSAPSQSSPGRTWLVKGLVPTGANTLYAWATCVPQ